MPVFAGSSLSGTKFEFFLKTRVCKFHTGADMGFLPAKTRLDQVRTVAGFMALTAACGMLRPIRDSMMIAAGIGGVPKTMAMTLAATLVVAPMIVFLAKFLTPAKAAGAIYLLFSVLLLTVVTAYDLYPAKNSARFIVILISTSNFILTASFWASIGGHQCRSSKQVRQIAAAGSIGALGGPLLALPLYGWFPNAAPIGAIIFLFTAWCLTRSSAEVTLPVPGVKENEKSSLILIIVFILLTSAGGTFLYIQQLPLVAKIAMQDERTRFFACAEAVSALLLLLTSLGPKRRYLEAPAAAVGIAAALLAIGVFPGSTLTFITLVGRRMLEQSGARPLRELAYNRLVGLRGREARIALDAVAGRIGDTVAAGTAIVLSGLGLLATGLAVSAALGAVSMRLQHQIQRKESS